MFGLYCLALWLLLSFTGSKPARYRKMGGFADTREKLIGGSPSLKRVKKIKGNCFKI
jgi:hypothetical protein